MAISEFIEGYTQSDGLRTSGHPTPSAGPMIENAGIPKRIGRIESVALKATSLFTFSPIRQDALSAHPRTDLSHAIKIKRTTQKTSNRSINLSTKPGQLLVCCPGDI